MLRIPDWLEVQVHTSAFNAMLWEDVSKRVSEICGVSEEESPVLCGSLYGFRALSRCGVLGNSEACMCLPQRTLRLFKTSCQAQWMQGGIRLSRVFNNKLLESVGPRTNLPYGGSLHKFKFNVRDRLVCRLFRFGG